MSFTLQQPRPPPAPFSRIPNPPPMEAIELPLQWVVVHRSLFGSLIVPHNLLQCVFNCDSTSKSSFDSPLTRFPNITGLQLTRPVSMRVKRGKLDILSSKTPCTQFNCDGLTGKENHLLRYPIISPLVNKASNLRLFSNCHSLSERSPESKNSLDKNQYSIYIIHHSKCLTIIMISINQRYLNNTRQFVYMVR